MAEPPADGSSERTPIVAIEQLADIPEYQPLFFVFEVAENQVVTGAPFQLAVLLNPARLVFPWDVEIPWMPTEDFKWGIVLESNQHDPILAFDVAAVNVAREDRRSLGRHSVYQASGATIG